MANKPESKCACVIDTSGLHGLATASGNLKATLIARLKDGTIGVPSWSWSEFKKLFPDEAAELAAHIAKRVPFSQPIHVRAARITEELRLGFSRGAYDEHVELFTASVALNKSYTVLTSIDNIDAYDGMKCKLKDLAEWVSEQE